MSKQEGPGRLNLASSSFTGPVVSNPLLNEVVLQTLFQHASLADLKNWRNVCKLWYENSLTRWRREIWVKLTDKKMEEAGTLFVDKYVDLMTIEDGTKEIDFYKFREHPFKRVKFEDQHFSFESLETYQNDFWQKCVTPVSHLEFKNCTFLSFLTGMYAICQYLPKLKTLRMCGNWYANHGEHGQEQSVNVLKSLTELEVDFGGNRARMFSVSEWAALVRISPNLMSLTLANTRNQLEVILLGMKPPNDKTSRGWDLKKFDMLEIDSLNLWNFLPTWSDKLCQLQFSLTELCLDIGKQTHAEAFKLILETYAGTLQKLVIYRGDLMSNFMDEAGFSHYFPFNVDLPNVSELWMIGAAAPRNLSFLQQIPNLKRLLIICNIGKSLMAAESFLCKQTPLCKLVNGRSWDEYDFNCQGQIVAETNFCQLKNLVCSKLEDFVVSGKRQGYCNPIHVTALAKLMPNLKRIMLGMGNDGFRVLCENWKQLEVLVVLPSAVDEFGLTGIVPGLKNYPRLPNITDLKSLRYFGTELETVANISSSLTDNSFFNGIAGLSNLQGLSVLANKTSTNVTDYLVARFPKGIHKLGISVREWEIEEESDETRSFFPNGSSSDASDESPEVVWLSDDDDDLA